MSAQLPVEGRETSAGVVEIAPLFGIKDSKTSKAEFENAFEVEQGAGRVWRNAFNTDDVWLDASAQGGYLNNHICAILCDQTKAAVRYCAKSSRMTYAGVNVLEFVQ